ncbi:ROK family transcriptional regulator [Couchioplanes caeruleus]|nr:ROK family transcriptional regulator [Couchioplanes caeruleus]UQU68554.1 ROK family transcriptional regulator [Couchioplanes caeruleus]
MPAAGQEEIRRQNLGAVLRYVHVHGPTSRAELTSRLGLNRSTIRALAADLSAAGLVSEDVPTSGRRAGRPSLVVSPRSERVYANALSIEPARLRAARVGLGGRILDLREAPRPRGMSPAEAVTELAALVRRMGTGGGDDPPAGDARGADGGDTLCAGGAVAVADTTRDDDGTLHVGGADDALAAALGAELGAGFVAGDMADIAALAEHTRGVAAGINDLVYLHGDTGVSAGIVTGGRLVTGHGGASGKVGHMVVNPGGRGCGCGSRGCWETEVGTQALLRRAGAPAGTSPIAVLRAAAMGDAVAREALRAVADWLGFGVANLVNVFNPDIVVFGGTLREVYAGGARTVRRRLDTMALPASREHLHLRAGALGPDAALIGAAELAFGALLSDPLNGTAAAHPGPRDAGLR